MIKGEISQAVAGGYKVKLENGQCFNVEKDYLPPALRKPGKPFQLLFGAAGAAASQEEARALLNHLLGAAA